MNCPVCNIELKMSERQGIEIDYCPKCRGVWLDRGELDKIIERATLEESEDDDRVRPASHQSPPTYAPPPTPGHVAPTAAPIYGQPNFPPPPASPHHPGAHPPNYNPNDDSKYGYPYRKKKSIWRELLDF